MRSACGIPDNGGGPCLEGDRLDALEAEQRRERLWREELTRAVHAQAGELGGIKESIHAIESDMFDQIAAMAGVVGEMRGLRRDLLSVRMPLPSLDYGEGDVTAVQDRPTIIARAKVAEHRTLTLEEENAALRATIEATERERERQSVRAEKIDARRWTKLQKIGAGVLAIIVALLGAGALELLRR